MAIVGEPIDLFFEFQAVTGSPEADVKQFDGVGALTFVTSVTFTQIGISDIFVGRFTIPSNFGPGSYVIEGSVVEASVPRTILERIEINRSDFRSKINDIAAPGRETEFGTFIKERLDRLTKTTLRTLAGQIERSPAEVEKIEVVFTRTKITAGDTPLFDFTIFDPITLIPTDLTGGTITFKGIDAANPSIIAWNRDCTIIDAELGTCEVRLTATDTATPALYDGIVEVELPGNISLTAQTFAVNILAPSG